MTDGHADSALGIRMVGAARSGLRKQQLEDEITSLFEQSRGPLLRYLSTFGLASHDGEEIVQEVFLSLFSHLQRNKARTNLRGWLFRVAHNLALKRRNAEKKAAGNACDTDTLPDPALNPEEEAASQQRRQRLSCILHALPEQDQRCLSLRAEGLRYREIADVLGRSLGSVAASLGRSLARFERADCR